MLMATTEARNLDTTRRHLREARLASGLSLRELARRAGTSHATLLAYEEGRKAPAITTWLRIVQAAGYAVDFRLERRIREVDGLARGDELAAALTQAEQFPATPSRKPALPRFPSKPAKQKNNRSQICQKNRRATQGIRGAGKKSRKSAS